MQMEELNKTIEQGNIGKVGEFIFVSSEWKKENSSLCLTISKGHTSIVKLLLEAGADITKTDIIGGDSSSLNILL